MVSRLCQGKLSGVRPRQFAKELAEAPTFFFAID